LQELAKRIEKVFAALNADYEIIMVDDCSADNSWAVIADIARSHSHFKGLQLLRNAGQTQATMAGIKVAGGDVVITMDDDLQHDPQQIPRLLEELEKDNGCDCVFAYFPAKKHSAFRNMASKIVRWINARAHGANEINISSFRVMRGYMAQIIRQHQSTSATVGGLILANTEKLRYVAIPHSERFAGKSNYTLARQFRLAFDNICSVSMLPLRMISATGLMASVLSALLLCYFLFIYFSGEISVPGWTSIIILVTFFSGLILLSLGVIGEYLVRVLRELQSTNVTTIRRAVGFDSAANLNENDLLEPSNSVIEWRNDMSINS